MFNIIPWSESQKVAEAIEAVKEVSNPNDVIPTLLEKEVNVMVVHHPLTIYVDEFRFNGGNKS